MKCEPIALSDAPRAGMQHCPHDPALVETHLHEVIAAAERAEVHPVVGAREHRIPLDESRETISQRRPGSVDGGRRRRAPGAAVALAGRTAVRHGTLDRRAHRTQAVRQIGRRERRLRGHHAAAEVDADRGRDDGLARRDDAAHRRALADMHVRHHRQVAEDERHARCARELLACLVLDRYAPRPHLHGRTARDIHDVVVLVAHGSSMPNAATTL